MCKNGGGRHGTRDTAGRARRANHAPRERDRARASETDRTALASRGSAVGGSQRKFIISPDGRRYPENVGCEGIVRYGFTVVRVDLDEKMTM